MQLMIGFTLSLLVGYAAFRFNALTRSGTVAAVFLGGLIFGLGGLPWASLLLIFFISSSLLSIAFRGRKQAVSEKFAKGARRDSGQVLANGGLALILVLIQWFFPQLVEPWIAFAGCMAAVNADTWATELGVLNPSPPRLITNGKVVSRGTSGGVTWTGYLAALTGAALIALAGAYFTQAAAYNVPWVILGGLVGATVDSILGATVQGIYYCPECGKETESYPKHHCETRTTQIRGWHWLNNDLINLFCSLIGAAVALGGWFLFT